MNFAAILFGAGSIVLLAGVAAADVPPAPAPFLVAGLPVAGAGAAPAATPVEPVQQQTCGCTAPPNPKQKILVKSGGRNVCTVTQMACWAP